MVNLWDMKRLNSVVGGKKTPEKSVAVPVLDGPAFKIDWCKVCHSAYPILTEVVQIDEFKNGLKETANNFCDANILPINPVNCKTKADQYIDIIAQVKDAEEGCKKLTLCPVNKETISFKFDLQVVDLGSSNGDIRNLNWLDDTTCTVCKLLIKGIYADLDKIIRSPATKDYINRACDHIHEDELKEKCKTDTLNALETLLKDFEKQLPPQQACELMEYCKKKAEFDYSTSLKPLAQCPACNPCKALFPVLHRVLQNQEVKETAIHISEQVCERSNKPDQCKSALSELIDNLADEETADAGCASLCKGDSLGVMSVFKVSKCTACQASMVAVDEIFKSDLVRHR